MPGSLRSLSVTEAYRTRLNTIRQRVEREAANRWPIIEELDRTNWPERMAGVLSAAQTEATRVTAGYLAAFLSSELGRRVTSPAIDSRRYAGLSRDGRPLSESLRSPLIGTFAALKDGKTPGEALAYGKNRAVRMVEMDLMNAARTSLSDAMEADDRIHGWQRSVKGTCGACLGDIDVEVSVELPSLPLDIHPNCQCVTQPVVARVPMRYPLATGAARFAQMSHAEQDRDLGPDTAKAIRDGDASLGDLVGRSKLDSDQPDFLTQKPLDAAT